MIAETNSYRAAHQELSLFDGVPNTLHQLQSHGIGLAVLSDTESPASVVYERLDGAGIGDLFDSIICSVDIGTVKPEPAAYRAACDALDIPAYDCSFVGHDQTELDGAKVVGLTTIAFNHAPNVEANYHVAHFAEILEVVLAR